ncbi:MAG: filamentous hemagglutinin N-terminal domain-containing protein [Coleofasciculus sp. D1-CHI-01]|uniref:two-partner secretion domain-containing protein n=1 Tax=Coleofasciculus sp. D1-CHI-01 TaxID=3068482 RepID=UPI0033042591
MNKIWSNQTKRVGFQLARGVVGVFSLGIACLSLPAFAQIVPDSTLGNESSQVTPNVNVGGSLGDRIDGGAVRGSSLFHSFSEFNVNNGQRVYFADPAGIENIFSRVTGSNISNILGTLGVEGAANLFLLNPNGILFGQNARLDIQGSFVASTGDRFVFPDGMEFGASHPQAPPLLTMSVPVGVQYGAQSGAITNAGKLEVGSGQTLALQGSDVTSTGSLSAPGGTVMMLGDRIGLFDNAQINVSSQTGGGTVLIGGGLQGNGTVPNAARTFVDAGVQIEADALVTGDGGSVIIWADEVTGFYGNISARGGIEAGNGGFVEVSGKENLIFRGNVDTSASQGNPGTLLLDPENITIVNGNGSADDSQLDDHQILQGDGSASSFTISQTKLEELSGDTNVILQATNDITVDSLANNALAFKTGTGSITFTADADENGVGSFLMQEQDTIYTNGRDIAISGASLTLGNIKTFSVSVQDNQSMREVVVDVDSGGPIPATGTEGTATFSFTVSEDLSASTISDLNVRFSAAHTWDADLDVSLKSPGGTPLNLFSEVGDSGDNFQDTLLDDEATTRIKDGTAPFIGSFKPQQSLAIFNNENPNGKWTLTVTDNFELDDGRLLKANEPAPWGRATGTQLIFQLNTNTNNERVITPVAGKSGSITLEATNGNISASDLNTSNNFGGDGGAISLTANGGDITADSINSSSESFNGNSGNGGAINLKAGDNLNANSISSSSESFSGNFGNGGAINLEAGDNLDADHISSSSFSFEGNSGNGGEINLEAGGNLDTDSISSSSESFSFEGNSGNGGEINLEAGGNLDTDSINSSSLSFEGNSGNGGNIHLEARTVILENSSIDALSSNGKGGDVIIITTEDDLEIPKIRLVNTSIDVTAQFSNNSSPSTQKKGGQNQQTIMGRTGNVTIDAGNRGSVELITDSEHQAMILTEARTNSENQKTGGDIAVMGGSVTIDGYQLSARVQENITGNGGDINITAPNSVTLTSNGQISAETSGFGDAGSVKITTPTLNINGRDGRARVSTTTTSTQENAGKGGDITVSANTLNLSGENSGLFAETEGTGTAGNLTLNPYNGNDLQVIFAQEAQISASTSGSGTGGNVTVSAPNSVTLTSDGNDQGGLSASASNQATGDGGSININARRLEMNGAIIRSEAQKSQAGDITLNLDDILLLRHNSLISTTAGTTQAPGNGGNITINAAFVIAVPWENSDIIANAFTGNGGEINITANRVLGLQQQNGQTFDTLRQNRTSDISVSSQFGIQGTVTIQSLNVDPSQGLGELPIDVVDPSNQIATGCGATGGTTANRQSEFVVTGRGGLPPKPDDLQTPGTLSPEWVTRDLGNVNRTDIPNQPLAADSTDALVEAQGMFINAKGELILTAQSSQTNPSQSGLSTKFCSPVSDRR